MNNKKLKQLLHKQRQHNKKNKLNDDIHNFSDLQSYQQFLKENRNNLKDNSYFTATKRGELMYVLRTNMARYFTSSEYFKSTSRFRLQEYLNNNIFVTGIVSDLVIVKDKNKKEHFRLLVERPLINQYQDKFGIHQVDTSKNKENGILIDSHIWLDQRELIGLSNSDITVSIGDYISFSADVSIYRGTVENNIHSYKLGLRNIVLYNSGVMYQSKNNKSGAVQIVDDYPRHGDWVLKIKDEGKVYNFEIKKSQWPSYKQRKKSN